MDVGLNIKVSADVKEAVRALGGLNDNLVEIATDGTVNIQAVNLALADLRKAAQNAGNTQELGMFNRAIRDLAQEAKTLKNVGLEDAFRRPQPAANQLGTVIGQLGYNTRSTRVGFIDLFTTIQGGALSPRLLANSFSLLGPAGLIAGAAVVGLIDLLTQQTDEEKKAAEGAKKLKEEILNLKFGGDVTIEATGSAQGNIARVRDLAAAVEDTNRSYAERKRALEELKETNKSYFGDLNLETKDMTLLASRVNDYAQALVTEAVIKGQVDEIAKMSSELGKQLKVQDQLHDAAVRAQNDEDAMKKNLSANIKTEGEEAAILQLETFHEATIKATEAFYTQRDAVDKIRVGIASYNGELKDNIDLQLKQRPLTVVKPEDEKSLDTLLSKIKEIKAEIAKPQEGPLFRIREQAGDPDIARLFKQKIAEAIQEGTKIGTAEGAKYAAELAKLYGQELSKIENPNLRVHVGGIVPVTPEDIDKISSQIEKSVGGKAVKIKVPVDFKESLEDSGFSKTNVQTLLKKATEDATKNMPTIRWTPKIQIIIDKAILQQEFKDQLNESLNKAITSSATSGLDQIGKSIGDAIAKGQNPVQAAGDAILGTIGGLIEQMGTALIKYGVETELIQDVLKGGLDIAPGVAIAAGVAMVAIGEVIKKSFKVPAFAEGGVVTGPTYGLIGEAGPEAIFPLSKISDFMASLPGRSAADGGSGGQFVIRGQDLVLVQQRANKNLSFVGKAT